MFDAISRTAVVGWGMTLVGFLGLIGIDLPVDTIEALLTSITEDAMALWLAVSGPVAVWFRTITDSPVAAGLKGWLGLRE